MRKALAGFFLLLAGCAGTSADEDAVREVIRMRAAALNAKNLSLYSSLLSPAFRDRGKDASTVRRDLAKSFTRNDSIRFRINGMYPVIQGNRATVRTRYDMKVIRGRNDLSTTGEETVILGKEVGCWKIVEIIPSL